jgi:hypothetical protein
MTTIKNRNSKGKGQSTSRQLSASEKVTLTLWMDKNKDACVNLSADELAIRFKQESSIDVSISSVLTMRNAVFPELKKTRAKRDGQLTLSYLMDEINTLHRELLFLKEQLGIVERPFLNLQ